ncbi:hypothetical protein [Candidatus Vondammii sp. HM_W22]|uniref:hypothetical protein n=1 Tax=Candidatus Vondammii sp. HM_W22 TaxID=2687299 RepID=UPI001F1351E7|nr:hypothetical protein [Candidatus Vondammii sp. HM_W22]
MRPPAHAHAAADAPIGAAEREVDIYINGVWTLVPDHRGTIYWLPDGSRHKITDLGIEPPIEALPEEPVIPPTEAEIIAAMERAIESYMDTIAQGRRWDNRWTCVARSGYPNAWQSEAVAYGQWMDECWAYAFQVQTDVQADNRTVPTAEELIAELPEMVSPD